MKKFFVSWIIMIIFLTSLTLTVSAKSYDSLYMAPEEVASLNAPSYCTVLKIYRGSPVYRFALKNSVVEATNESDFIHYLFVYYKDCDIDGDIESTARYHFYNERLEVVAYTYNCCDWIEFGKYAISPELVFDSTINVEQVYCMEWAASNGDICIYYVTDAGDYVLFKEHHTDDETYLFPIDEFYEFAEILNNERMDYSFEDDGIFAIDNELFDAEQYLFEPKQENESFTWIIITSVSATVIIVGITTVVFIKRKNKNKII